MKVIEWLKNNLGKVIAVPVAISSGNFLILFAQSISDGVINDEELRLLIEAGSGIQLVCLTIVMAILKVRK